MRFSLGSFGIGCSCACGSKNVFVNDTDAHRDGLCSLLDVVRWKVDDMFAQFRLNIFLCHSWQQQKGKCYRELGDLIHLDYITYETRWVSSEVETNPTQGS